MTDKHQWYVVLSDGTFDTIEGARFYRIPQWASEPTDKYDIQDLASKRVFATDIIPALESHQ